jgi:hypothetical protein
VAFQVGLIDHVQAVPVAQVEEVRVRRVMAGANGVDVVLLHQEHVAEHVLAGHGAPVVRVVLVAVHAPQFDRLAVDEHPPVLEFHPAKPTDCGTTSTTCPCSSFNVSSSVYRRGASADQSSGACTGAESSTGVRSPDPTRRVLAGGDAVH